MTFFEMANLQIEKPFITLFKSKSSEKNREIRV